MPTGPARRLQSERVWRESSCCFGGIWGDGGIEFGRGCLSTPATYLLRQNGIERLLPEIGEFSIHTLFNQVFNISFAREFSRRNRTEIRCTSHTQVTHKHILYISKKVKQFVNICAIERGIQVFIQLKLQRPSSQVQYPIWYYELTSPGLMRSSLKRGVTY